MPKLARALSGAVRWPYTHDHRGLGQSAALLAVAANFASVFAAGLFRGVTFLLAVILWSRDRDKSTFIPAAVLPALCFAAWTLVAVIASPHPFQDIAIFKKFYLLMWLLVVPFLFRPAKSIVPVFGAAFVMAGVSGAVGIVEYAAQPGRDLMHRISGLLSHWMSFSAVLMLALVALLAYLLLCGRRKWWPAPLLLLIGTALLLSLTRNAWLGSVTGAVTVLALVRPKATPLLLAGIAAIYFANPWNLQGRVRASFDSSDSTTAGRMELLRTSTRLIRDNPWFGVGPKSVGSEALRYRTTQQFPDWLYQHMHNNALQIAAERGLPGLLLWLWFMIRLLADAWRLYRQSHREAHSLEAHFVSVAALGAWVAFVTAGMLEYNFGDSEVLSLFMFFASAPYAFEIR